ncbi:MAG TPA: hypothetical protein ENK92_03835 [Bacteroidetes bacterium]|nr:hypothetical protein [Bacteroidota bacterium]
MTFQKFIRYFLEIMLIIIAVIMMFSTFIPLNHPPQFYSHNYPPIIAKLILSLNLDNFYASVINIGVWGVFTLLLLIFISSGAFKRKSVFALHTIIFLMALTIFCDKAFKREHFLKIREGGAVNLGKFLNDDSEKYNFDFKLLDFTKNFHQGSRMPSAFISEVELENGVKKKIEVNKPLTIGNYKFYQSTYDALEQFQVEIDSVQYTCIQADTLIADSLALQITKTNNMGMIEVVLNEKVYQLTEDAEHELDGHKIKLIKLDPIYISGFQISSIYGMTILFVLAILFIINLGWCFWRRK